MEEWRSFNDKYEVSNFGKLRNKVTGHTLSQRMDRYGYMVIGLSSEGKTRTETVHRVVAKTFIPNLGHKKQVNHIDGDKTNNRVENLEWCDASRNIRHRVYELGVNPLIQTKQILCVENGKVFPSVREAARWAGVPHNGIVLAAQHKPQHKTAGGYHWEYC